MQIDASLPTLEGGAFVLRQLTRVDAEAVLELLR